MTPERSTPGMDKPPAPAHHEKLRQAAEKALGEMQWMLSAVAMSRNSRNDPAVVEAEGVYAELEAALAQPTPGIATPAPLDGEGGVFIIKNIWEGEPLPKTEGEAKTPLRNSIDALARLTASMPKPEPGVTYYLPMYEGRDSICRYCRHPRVQHPQPAGRCPILNCTLYGPPAGLSEGEA